MRTTLLTTVLIGLVSGCTSDVTTSATMGDDPDKPDAGWAHSEALDLYKGAVSNFEDLGCEKVLPITNEAINQNWNCNFTFEVAGKRKECGVIISYEPDDHAAYWKTWSEQNLATNEFETTLSCKDKTN